MSFQQEVDSLTPLVHRSIEIAPKDFRADLPRFADENRAGNQKLVDAFAKLARERGVTPARLVIAWERAKSEQDRTPIVPTLGAHSRQQLSESLAALSIEASPNDVAALEAAVPASEVVGTRCVAALMVHSDSER